MLFQIDTKESLRKALLKLTERPGMYVGTDRLDYLENFSAGWGMVAPAYPWDADREIQEWIFLRESVSMYSGSMHGRSLIPRCYGNRMEAITQYRELLEEVAFNSREDEKRIPLVCWQIIGVNSLFEEDGFADRLPVALKQAVRELVGETQRSYKSIIPVVSRMIGEVFEDLWVYLHFDGCFVCVKFLYHTEEGGWKEHTALAGGENYFQNLLILHGYATFVQKEEHHRHIITLRHRQGVTTVNCKETEDIWHDISSYYGNKPLCQSYAEWKEGILLEWN